MRSGRNASYLGGNYAVDPSSAPQELNHSPDVLCILVVRVVETRGIYDHALGPICDPETWELTGLVSKTMAFNAFSF